MRRQRWPIWKKCCKRSPQLWFLESTAFKVGYAHTQAKPQSLEALKCLAAAAVKSSVDSDYYACMPPFVDRPREKQTVAYYILILSHRSYLGYLLYKYSSYLILWLTKDRFCWVLSRIENSVTKARRRDLLRIWYGFCPVCILQKVTWNFFGDSCQQMVHAAEIYAMRQVLNY